jgi:hypothetical protein
MKKMIWLILVGLIASLFAGGCSRQKNEVKPPVGTIYYSGPMLPKTFQQGPRAQVGQ